MIDNYDSFVYNLVQILGKLHPDIKVARNDAVTISKVSLMKPAAIVISPGPGTPENAGMACEIISHFAGTVPILGVCLGHQAIADAFGGRVVRADQVIHGKVSEIHHDGMTVFKGIEDPFIATRYHSLIVDPASLPECLKVSAWTKDGVIMGIRHKVHQVEGIQFHPESFLTTCGERILENFVDIL